MNEHNVFVFPKDIFGNNADHFKYRKRYRNKKKAFVRKVLTTFLVIVSFPFNRRNKQQQIPEKRATIIIFLSAIIYWFIVDCL